MYITSSFEKQVRDAFFAQIFQELAHGRIAEISVQAHHFLFLAYVLWNISS